MNKLKIRILLVVVGLVSSGCESQRPRVVMGPLGIVNTYGQQVLFKTAFSGKPLGIHHVAAVHPDCSAEETPTIRILTQPAHGAITLEQTEDYGLFSGVRAECSKKKIQGTELIYTSEPTYVGRDHFAYEVIDADGGDRSYDDEITVK